MKLPEACHGQSVEHSPVSDGYCFIARRKEALGEEGFCEVGSICSLTSRVCPLLGMLTKRLIAGSHSGACAEL